MLDGLPLTLPWQDPDGYSAFHLYIIRLQLDKTKRTHLQIFEFLRSRNIIVNLHYIPVHTQPYYQALGFKQGDFPEAERYYTEAISIPMYPTLTNAEQAEVVDAIKDALAQ